MSSFKLTAKQKEANKLLGGPAMHCLLYGGSRSTKTFTFLRAMTTRALKAKRSRHAVLRFKFNHVKSSIVYDTFPKMMDLCYPAVNYELNKSDWFAELPNGSQIWFGGLDEKDRAEKILGNEYATILLNEISQLPYSSYLMAKTRLAQRVTEQYSGGEREMKLKMYLDENPPSKEHWSYKLFIDGVDPDTKRRLKDPSDYCWLQMNPADNAENLPASYLNMLDEMPDRMRRRFYLGEFADTDENALWRDEIIDRYRILHESPPDFQRIVIGVDPSGCGDEENAHNDAIGIIVVALGTDGHAYVLEDLTLKAGPAKWGAVVASAFDRHGADRVVAEVNYGGAMVEGVIRAARPSTPYKAVTATRGKVVRAEPISTLYEQGKVHHMGYFPDLESELCAFTTTGYRGTGSPNRADALVWAVSELFPVLTKPEKQEKKPVRSNRYTLGADGWMAA